MVPLLWKSTRNALQEARMGADVRRATHESFRNPSRLTHSRFVPDDCGAWTLNASLTTSSSYKKCSKRRTLDHSAQATSRLRIGGTMRHSPIARGFGCGRGMASVADTNPSAQTRGLRELDISTQRRRSHECTLRHRHYSFRPAGNTASIAPCQR
jgi:hypothetical protein